MIEESWRLDARYFAADFGHSAYLRVTTGPWPKSTPGELVGSENIWSPSRFARVYAQSHEFGKPYLAPYDTIRYLPTSNDILSRSETHQFEQYEIEEGWLLITCSGRNLGPCVHVDNYLSQFAVSHDMVRIASKSRMVFYIMAFLHTSLGQELIRRDKNGSVIDHIGPRHIRDLAMPMVEAKLVDTCISAFEEASALRERARISLLAAQQEYDDACGFTSLNESFRNIANQRKFTVNSSKLGSRLDAEYYAPLYTAISTAVNESSSATEIGEIADIARPTGRERPVYVSSTLHGYHHLSGRNVVQYRPVGLKIISPLSFSTSTSFLVERGWTLLTADGRAEEGLADCALVSWDREGWSASTHVHRLVPREGISPGLLYLVCNARSTQLRLKSRATGSVVDALSEGDIRTLRVAFPSSVDELGDMVSDAWEMFADATLLENDAAHKLEAALIG